ncbi:hypothetical protein [Planctomyces sp. SH-PL14]|uniref:hypothetical protein n=1 Tax=Planctomyces sp. SH-PL14 TaxID=1632864 RepID=UPI00078CAC7F|nr:hypothetical protein [Planctomyces sp. SH-PL14]AMV22638.1 hypothetical protein VT03_32380 [Planctomyces sp. SH-PL14]
MKFSDHPLNKEMSEFLCWLWDKVDEGHLSAKRRSDIVHEANLIFDRSGLTKAPDATPIAVAVFRHSLHVMKEKTIEACPELADEVRNMGSGQSR